MNGICNQMLLLPRQEYSGLERGRFHFVAFSFWFPISQVVPRLAHRTGADAWEGCSRQIWVQGGGSRYFFRNE